MKPNSKIGPTWFSTRTAACLTADAIGPVVVTSQDGVMRRPPGEIVRHQGRKCLPSRELTPSHFPSHDRSHRPPTLSATADRPGRPLGIAVEMPDRPGDRRDHEAFDTSVSRGTSQRISSSECQRSASFIRTTRTRFDSIRTCRDLAPALTGCDRTGWPGRAAAPPPRAGRSGSSR